MAEGDYVGPETVFEGVPLTDSVVQHVQRRILRAVLARVRCEKFSEMPLTAIIFPQGPTPPSPPPPGTPWLNWSQYAKTK